MPDQTVSNFAENRHRQEAALALRELAPSSQRYEPSAGRSVLPAWKWEQTKVKGGSLFFINRSNQAKIETKKDSLDSKLKNALCTFQNTAKSHTWEVTSHILLTCVLCFAGHYSKFEVLRIQK